jgi:hypothetical protein
LEAIFGVIEDLIERFKSNDPKEKEEAKHELKTNFASLTKNLESMGGNAEAVRLLNELKSLKLD